MEGILLVDKPKNWTSFDVVNHIRAIVAHELGLKPKNFKVGHTGTLDPAATGLLVLCIGKKYTKKVPEMIIHNKTYQAEITFGSTSTTGDSEGIITQDKNIKKVEHSELLESLKKFVGTIAQTPPAYSAIKIGGKRAYELAREGKKVELKSREVHIYSIELIDFNWPTANIICKVGSGTYIRTLAEDIGREIGVGAYLSSLHRTEVDKWNVKDSVEPKNISIDIIKEKLLV